MEHTTPLKPADNVSFVASADLTSERIDHYLARTFTAHSRTFFQKLITQGCITVNQSPVTKPSAPLRPNDTITIAMPSPVQRAAGDIQTNHLAVEVLHEHEHFLIINKPAGLIVHQPHAHATTVTLVDWLLAHYAELRVWGDLARPGIVHRLDKDTSGLLIIARTPYAHAHLSNLFKEHTLQKTYLALVEGKAEASGTITIPIGRHPVVPTRMAALYSGRKAVTHYQVKEHFSNASLLEVHPITGRTHQIRVHCASIQHPLIGDTLYGNPSESINRQALHAYKIAFVFEETSYEFSKEPPVDFQNACAALRNS